MFERLPLIMDGATGTQLQKAGMPAGCCTELWALENPEKLVALQRDYVAAGAQMLYAPTFGANSENLKKHGAKKTPADICRKLVALSRRAAGGKALVIGDISATGLLVEPYGDTGEDELFDIFAEQAQALEDADVDLFGIETQMYLDEARIAARAVRSVSKKPLIVSFSCGATGKTLWGEDLCVIAEELAEFELSAFGINCCGDLDVVCTQLERLSERLSLPLIAKPNAGLPVVENGVTRYDMTPETMGSYALKFYERGARLIGGCCGTGPEHIAAIKKALESAARD